MFEGGGKGGTSTVMNPIWSVVEFRVRGSGGKEPQVKQVPPTAPLVSDGGTNINDGRHHSGSPPDACPDAAATAPITANSALNIGDAQSVIWLGPPLAVAHDTAAPDAPDQQQHSRHDTTEPDSTPPPRHNPAALTHYPRPPDTMPDAPAISAHP
ncbi:hypothetical protein FB451DRAFT_1414184 [Mycena latifolia]|nr:hypothetical protein FB451DRAFT_1414184 [Mycena latifolia]